MFHQIGIIMITVSNMERSTAFYRDILGLSLQFSSPDWTQFEVGGVQVALHIAGPNRRVNAEVGDNFGFYIDDMDKTLDELTSRGAEVAYRTEEDFGTLSAIKDPDGYTIQLCQLKHNH